MGEPRLEDISDYNTLEGEKKKVVWAVVLVGLFMGILYAVVASNYQTVDDALPVDKTMTKVPLR